MPFIYLLLFAGVWDKVLEPIVRLRKEADMLQLFPEYLRGEEMFGLTVQAVLRITESVRCSSHLMLTHFVVLLYYPHALKKI